jgi:hypothetical protein
MLRQTVRLISHSTAAGLARNPSSCCAVSGLSLRSFISTAVVHSVPAAELVAAARDRDSSSSSSSSRGSSFGLLA